MAVVMYKDGEVIRIHHKSIQNHLALGWSFTSEPCSEPKEPDIVTLETIDTNGSGKLSVEEIRQAAKDSGIEGWDSKRVKTLRKELGLGD